MTENIIAKEIVDAGACTSAMFLREFAGDTPWIHLDIAGNAWLDAPAFLREPSSTWR